MANWSPAHAAPITPSDTEGLGFSTDLMSFVNTGSQTLTIDTVEGEVQTVITLPSGQWQIRATKVWETGTTVTNLVGFWD